MTKMKLDMTDDQTENITKTFSRSVDTLNDSPSDIKNAEAKQRRHWSARLFWSTIFVISFICCSLMVYKTYNKWQSSPIIISFDDKMTSISEIPFPAITICPEMRIGDVDFDIEEMERKLKKLKNEKSGMKISDVLTAEEQKVYEAILHVCLYNYTTLSESFNNILEGHEILSTLKGIEEFQRNNFECSYGEIRDQKCMSKTLNRVGIGICRTFNTLNTNDFFNIENIAKDHYFESDEFGTDNNKNSSWSLESGYCNTTETHPMHYSGRYEAIEVFRLKISRSVKTFTKTCNGAYKGYRVYLHSPDEVTTKHYFRVNMGTEVIVKVVPKMSIISESLKKFSSDHRKCYLSGERKLKYFKHYSQNNCRIECLSNFTFSECGCVKFNMLMDSTMRICQQKDIKCYKKVDKIFTASGKVNATYEAERNCHCWPSCTTLVYDYDIFTAEYGNVEKAINDGNATELVERAFIKINFKDTEFLKLKKIEIYDSLDFLANCGGLFGLFMGFSIVSLLDTFYLLCFKCFSMCACLKKSENEKMKD